MVTWGGDATMAGYDPITHALKQDMYHLATPGTVDTNAITRFGFALNDANLYPQRLFVKAPFSFVAGDFSANPGKYLSAALYVVNAGFFAPGFVPKPSDILALGDAKINTYRATMAQTSAGAITFSFFEPTEMSGYGLNSKWWILILPTAVNPSNPGAPSLVNDPPMPGVNVDTFGRCISWWMNRTPAAPTITSAPNAVVSPGGIYNFTYSPNDPDAVTPNDTQRANIDLQGLYVQYARQPTPSDPNPEWQQLTMKTSYGPGLEYMFWISTILNENYPDAPNPLWKTIDNQGFPIICGVPDADVPLDTASLPGGDWQIRIRTADYGNPYPLVSRNPARRFTSSWNGWPEDDKSPWSAPIKISVPSQVPPPVPIYPTDSIAIRENQTVRLSWEYRNTHLPPRSQFRKVVQIRKVGDPDWSQVFNVLDGLPYVDLPVSITQTPILPVEYLSDGGFETGGTDSWARVPNVTDYGPYNTPDGGITNRSASPAAYQGTKYLWSIPDSNTHFTYVGIDLYLRGFYGFKRDANLLPQHDQFATSGAYFVPTNVNDVAVFASISFWDANGVQLVDLDNHPEWTTYASRTIPANDAGIWRTFTLGPITRPGAAAYVEVAIAAQESYQNPNSLGKYYEDIPLGIDNMSIIGSSKYPLVDFHIEATTQYEWRVLTIDTDGIASSFSSPARFWVVPEGASDGDVPVPSGTIDGGTLGCGTHTIQIFRRGGTRYVGTLTGVTYVDWGRVRDDMSTSKIVVKNWGIDCGNLLSELQTWAYEVVIWRSNGNSNDRVWEGPITLLTYENDAVTIQAKDVMAYAYRRIIRQRMSDAGTGNGTTVVDRAARVLRNAFAPDDPNILPYLQVLSRADDAMQYRSTPAYSRTAFEEVDDMAAKSGLDYTAVGRAILLWGTKHRIGTLPEFRDKDLGASPIVSEYGMQFANRYAVSDGNGVWGEATRLDEDGNDPTYGLVEMLSSTWASDSDPDSGTYTQAGLQTVISSFEGYAERSISDRNPPPVVVRIPDNTTLNPETVVSIQQLVPGVVIPLRSTSTLRKVADSQKLDSVSVTETDGKETITITVSPFSRDDGSADTEDAE